MTCEVVVMNTRGVAMAADSAVALGDGEKIYRNAEKLMQLAPAAPVGIMTFGTANLLGVPWDTIVAGYHRHLRDRTFDRLEDYLHDFVAFIEAETVMFPDAEQRAQFGHIAKCLWTGLYARRWRAELRRHPRRSAGHPHDALRRLIEADHPEWDDYPELERSSPEFADEAIAACQDALAKAERAAFEEEDLPEDLRTALYTTLRLFLTRAGFLGPGHAGLVIAGMGEAEPFPGLLFCQVGPIVNGRLKSHVVHHASISHEQNALVLPFAQRETIDLIVEGIHPGLLDSLPEMLADSMARHLRRSKSAHDAIRPVKDTFRDRLRAEIAEKHSGPLIDAVGVLPRRDLATMAETLVNLTVFRTYASANAKETVAGPTDVAVLSKSEGFVWFKRKAVGLT